MQIVAVLCITIIVATLTTFCSAANTKIIKGEGFEYSCIGNCNTDAHTPTTRGTVLTGGGEGALFVDDAFKWMIELSGFGDFVVIRTHGDIEQYNSYIYSLANASSVATFVIESVNGSNNPFVYEKIRNAEALFIAGGDQFEYLNRWNGTQVQYALQYLMNTKQVPIGGSSAGMAVMGQFIFTAALDTVTSEQALANPYTPLVTIASNFLFNPFLRNVITDTHFYQMDRIGRSIVFMSRILQDKLSPSSTDVRAVACDESTSVLIDAAGQATFVCKECGENHVAYLFRASHIPDVCKPGMPLTFRDIEVVKAKPFVSRFDFTNWTGKDVSQYTLNAIDGKLYSTQPGGAIY